MEKIKIGVIGVGVIATAVHIPQIFKSNKYEIVAICDIDIEKLNKVGKELNIPKEFCFSYYLDLINCERVDVIDICTPNYLHYQMCMESIKVGKKFSVEKPITLTKKEAKDIADNAKKKNINNMVCFSYRFKPAVRYAKDLIESGKIGRIKHIKMEYSQSWALELKNTPYYWRFQKEFAGSGALGDLGSHALDLVRFITGKEYTYLISDLGTEIKMRKKMGAEDYETVDVDDFCNIIMKMEDDIRCSFLITRLGYGRGNYQRLEIYGEKGGIIYRLDVNPDIDDEIFGCFGEEDKYEKLDIPEKYNITQMEELANIINGNPSGFAATVVDGYINQVLLDGVIESNEKESWINCKIAK
ncbi:MAG: Gfo/Idh/MocA family protein [Lachnospirales bacterium]